MILKTKILLIAAGAVAALTARPQGTGMGVVGFSNVGAPLDKRVYVADLSIPPQLGFPADSRYSIAFYWSEAGNRWTQIGGNTDFLDGVGAGQFLGGNRSITGLSANGAVVDIVAKAWSKASGNSYDAAIASGSAAAGMSPIVTIKAKDPGNVLETVPLLYQDSEWVAWAIFPPTVPEPSLVALGLLGAVTMLMFGKRR